MVATLCDLCGRDLRKRNRTEQHAHNFGFPRPGTCAHARAAHGPGQKSVHSDPQTPSPQRCPKELHQVASKGHEIFPNLNRASALLQLLDNIPPILKPRDSKQPATWMLGPAEHMNPQRFRCTSYGSAPNTTPSGTSPKPISCDHDGPCRSTPARPATSFHPRKPTTSEHGKCCLQLLPTATRCLGLVPWLCCRPCLHHGGLRAQATH